MAARGFVLPGLLWPRRVGGRTRKESSAIGIHTVTHVHAPRNSSGTGGGENDERDRRWIRRTEREHQHPGTRCSQPRHAMKDLWEKGLPKLEEDLYLQTARTCHASGKMNYLHTDTFGDNFQQGGKNPAIITAGENKASLIEGLPWVPHATWCFPWTLSFNPHSVPVKWRCWPLRGLGSETRTILSGPLCSPAASALSFRVGAGRLPPERHTQLRAHVVPAQLPQKKGRVPLLVSPQKDTGCLYVLCLPLDPPRWPRGGRKILGQGLRALWLEVPELTG